MTYTDTKRSLQTITWAANMTGSTCRVLLSITDQYSCEKTSVPLYFFRDNVFLIVNY